MFSPFFSSSIKMHLMPIRRHTQRYIRRFVGQTHTQQRRPRYMAGCGDEWTEYTFTYIRVGIWHVYYYFSRWCGLSFGFGVCEHFDSMVIHSHEERTHTSWTDGAQFLNGYGIGMYENWKRVSVRVLCHIPLNCVVRLIPILIGFVLYGKIQRIKAS